MWKVSSQKLRKLYFSKPLEYVGSNFNLIYSSSEIEEYNNRKMKNRKAATAKYNYTHVQSSLKSWRI